MNIYGNLTRLYMELYKRSINPKETKDFNQAQITEIVKNKFGDSVKIYFNDYAFRCVDKEFLNQLISTSFWSMPSFNYVSDFGDCENYAEFFNGFVSINWNVNTMGKAFGTFCINGVWYKHAFSMPILLNNGKPELYLYDPMYNITAKIEDINNIKVGDFIYRVTDVQYN